MDAREVALQMTDEEKATFRELMGPGEGPGIVTEERLQQQLDSLNKFGLIFVRQDGAIDLTDLGEDVYDIFFDEDD